MFELHSLLLFSLASFLLIILPGPAVLFIIAQSLDQGKKSGLVAVLGIATGAALHVLFAAFGLSVILMKSALAFAILKYIGAAYLIYLGIQSLGKPLALNTQQPKPKSLKQLYYDGFIVNVFNPKIALFFLAFLPQFIDAQRANPTLQILILGAIFISIALISDSIYALLAGQLGQLMRRRVVMARVQKYFSASMYILLGMLTALALNKK